MRELKNRHLFTGIILFSVISVAFPCPQADLTGDCFVDFDDLLTFVGQWLDPTGCAGYSTDCADIVGGNGVNFLDFALLAMEWGQGQSPVVINEIHYNPDMPTQLVEFVELYNTSSEAVDISGWHFCDGLVYTFGPGTTIAANGYIVVAEDPTPAVSPTTITGKYGTNSSIVYTPFAGGLSNDGEKIELCDAYGIEVDQVDYQLGFPWPTVGDEVPEGAYGNGHSIQLIHPELDNDLGGSWRSAYPTPGAANSSVYAVDTPPQIRQVDHTPNEPKSGEIVTVTAKVTDPDGVASVILQYQLVNPGSYIRIQDTAYGTTWTNLVMHDDGLNGDEFSGDDIYTIEMPAGLQTHRRLIRYRITVEDTPGNSVRVPYDDDPQPNFAYFVYDGVPAWIGEDRPGVTPVETFSSDLLTSIPIYHLIADGTDVERCQYNSSYKDTRFRGTLIYDGEVYDHVGFNIRGEFSTYVTGKNKWRYRFHRGHYFQARDNFGKKYKSRWKNMKVNGGAAPWTPPNRGMAGIDECLPFRLFELAGIPTSRTSYFHFRVIDGADEATSVQYLGDMWGLYYSVEVPDSRFLSDRDMPDGNLYKLESPLLQHNQGESEPVGPTDIFNVRSLMSTSSSEQWWRDNVDHLAYGRYKGVAEAVTHYDQREQSQGYYFHNPETEKWTLLPWDLDTMFQLTGKYYTWDRIRLVIDPSYPNLLLEAENEQREILDLLFNATAVDTAIAELANIVNPAGQTLTWSDVDQFVWNYHPKTVSKGSFNLLTASGNPAGHTYTRTLISADHEGQMDYIRKFMQPDGWGYDKLVAEVADSSIPNTPSVAYTGTDSNYPENGLTFETTAFSDPQGAGTFAAMKWRIAEVEPSSVPSTPPSGGGTVSLIAADSEWKYFKGTEEPSSPTSAWRQLSFNDDGWLSGETPIGYGPPVTTELTDMQDNYTIVYLRKEFQINNPADIETLRFSLNYDEGFNVWINGTHLDSINVSGEEVPYDAFAVNYVSGQTSTVLTYSNPDSFLVSGTNVMAIQLLNKYIDSSDILFDPVLEADLVENPGNPGGYDFVYTGEPGKYEIEAIWESEEITVFDNTIRIPADGVKAGRTYRVRCKMKDDTGRWSHWSYPKQFVAGEAINADILAYLRVSEVMYNNGDADFIELENISDSNTLDLSDVSITDGVTFSFAGSGVTTLAPGDFVLVVKDQAAFEAQYGTGLNSKIAGTFVDSSLSNGGEVIKVEDYWNGTIIDFEYNDSRGWPIVADGAGHSIVPLSLAMEEQSLGTLDYGANWRQSSYIGGSPGTEDPTAPTATAVINEFMAHTDYQIPPHESNDWIELYNAGTSTVSLNGNWYMSDDGENLKKYALPTASFASGDYISYDQVNHFNPDGTGPSGWGLNKAGDELFLSYLPGTGEDRVVDCLAFKGQENSVSLSRYPDGGSYWLATFPHTQDGANSNAVDRVVISEIMYHPQEDTATVTYDEYVELYNPTGSSIDLWTVTGPWALDGGVDYTFPASTTLNSGDRIIIVDFDPADSVRLAAFESAYGTGTLTAGVDIFGPWSGDLSNNGERLTLEKPQDSDDPLDPAAISWIIVDECVYNDYWPWPVEPDGAGDSLNRISSAGVASGNDPANWQSVNPSPGV
ncbi:MAG: lamin tail domain-containing protein [Planctomycetota bacterium]